MSTDDADDLTANPAISVCVPTYNNSATLVRCLRTILDQDGVDFEIVVVDDDSSDGCAAIAATMLRPGDRLIRNDTRLGLNANHNKCIELARGTRIQFVHADDWLLPGALQRLASCFDDPAVGLAFAPRRIVQDDLPWRYRTVSKPHKFFPALREHNKGSSLVAQMMLMGGAGNWIGEPTSVMFRRELALAVAGLRDDIYQLVDMDLWFRLMLRSAVCFVPHELSVRTHWDGTESIRNARTGRGWLDHLRILTWLMVDPASTRAIQVFAAVWWPLIWLALYVQVALFGPRRWSRLKTLVRAPVQEFAHARRLAMRLSRR
ncbi:glycosyltransferase family 2 protein [Afipia sp. GAS231]|uniref:glycosyltransferase family 2 protein n=1 Tax=Afipia sp. GAS231 TaxID=1882747 RepID=UPI00087AEF35|nr:glycosyltransferase family 2 protein [Afipia sp. GAS231]SDO34752.1 Glycosyl transferase family 2 [Afipia sp. GAS231]